jgi:hypothetical protein
MPKPITEQQTESQTPADENLVPVRKPRTPKAKPAAKKAPAKAVGVPAAKAEKKAPEPKERPDRTMADIPTHERRIALVKALRVARAVSPQKALATNTLVERLGYTKFDVYGLCRGTSGHADSNPRCLVATGHVAVADVEGQGISFYLTPAGQKTKFTEVPFIAGRAPKAE